MRTLGLPGRAPSASFYGPMRNDYRSKGTQPLGSHDTGQNRVIVANPSPSSYPTIVNGRMTNTIPNTATGTAASYSECDLGPATGPRTIGGKWIWTPGSGGGNGAAGFIFWNYLHQDASKVPDSAFHMSITSTSWQILKWISGAYSSIDTANWATPLPADGSTEFSFNATLDPATGAATMIMPDGTTLSRTYPVLVSGPGLGRISCHETYQLNANLDAKASFTQDWAS